MLQARILEWVAIPASRGSSWPRDWTRVSSIAGRFFTFWATRETLYLYILYIPCLVLALTTPFPFSEPPNRQTRLVGYWHQSMTFVDKILIPLSLISHSWLQALILCKPWDASSILKEINPAYSLEGLKLKLQSFGHLMQRTDSFEKTLMLGKIEGGRRRGWQRMRWLGGITDSMEMSLSELRGDSEGQGNQACCAGAQPQQDPREPSGWTASVREDRQTDRHRRCVEEVAFFLFLG